ncbi:hypothetical protein COCVIDRAFT_31332 [Bipolaris victoriae FI3]|uniref:Uncharacterized protein n=1 Tax=Bipolaris victoriae (strain FI3) TaxID=930091 RepID=W7DTS6_BIPV3|nr:hypothetical protein COCVIDRAFT_31332 [Bipolaris victoriae FI3]
MHSTTLIAVFTGLLSYTSATFFHVNRGCIYLNDIYICAPSSRVIGNGVSKVEARLDKPDHCVKTFRWPSYYQDVYYGADNCLYDASSNRIDNQCC